MTTIINNTGVLPWRKHLVLVVIVVAYIVLAVVYSIATPIFEASDELWHYPMIKFIADHGFTLPVQSPADPGPMRQEGSQPPLYYMLGAALTAGINTADMDAVRVLNPHPDLGVLRPDGNINTVVHSPQAEGFPWHGAVLAVHLVRFFSVLLGAVTVVLTYRLSLELLPGNRAVALGAAAFAAFNPMFLFISGAINNDNLSTALATLLLVRIAYLATQTGKPSARQYIAIGVVAGCGMLAKFNIGFLLPFVAVALGLAAHRRRDWRVFVVGAAISGGLTVLIAGWWYVRNWTLYGDPTGLNIFLQIVGQREIPANAAQLWSERHTFLMSYWGFFGAVNVPLPDQVYTVFNAIAAVSALSLAGAVSMNLISAVRIRGAVRLTGLGWARLFAALWVVVLFVSLLRWTQATWASQGRLMFAALAPLSIGMSIGLWWLGRAIRFVRGRLIGGAVVWFVLIAALAPILIARSYGDPSFLVGLPEGGALATLPIAEFQDDGPNPQVLRVSDCCALPTSVYPGQYLTFDVAVSTPSWQPSATSWSLFVHLVDRNGLIVAQRDVLLRQGLWATTHMHINPPGLQWINRIAVLLPDHAYTPSTLNIVLGFADSDQPSHRMRAIAAPSDTPRPATKDMVTIGSVQLRPRPAGTDNPNPTTVNFGDVIDFLGYDVTALKIDPAQSVEVTLYWRARRPLTTDYTAFVHIFNPATTEIFGGSDGMARPTSTWPVGTTIVDKHSFTIKADAPPGTWQIEIGLYDYAGGQFNRLRVVTPDGGQANNFLLLSRVLIGAKR